MAGVDAFDLHLLLPKFDCGLCGNPICMTLARNILSNIQKPVDCPFITLENMKKINELIPTKDVVRKHPHPNVEDDIIEIHPCTEDGKVTLETQLKSKTMNRDFYSDIFDSLQLCKSLSEVEIFDNRNCSKRMGYGLVEIKGKRVHIFKTGRIIMRRADDREDALGTFSRLSNLLLPARICSCGNILADCFGGSCETCSKDVCAAHLDHLEMTEAKDGIITAEKILDKYDNKKNEKLANNFEDLRNIVDIIRNIHEELNAGHEIDKESYKEEIDKIADNINKICMENILNNKEKDETEIALIQYGLARDLIRARDGFLSLESIEDNKTYKTAAELFFDSYEAFEKKDVKASKDVIKRYEEFKSTLETNSEDVGIAKIATNGFYISRIFGKPLPRIKLHDVNKKIS
ncbi:MAG: hypothetical protein JSW00_10015 [Thermoplasmata archaeon]|nr:MAG: hypothetical protein JSW00_10015 [Thermoplasmata archaeon]